VEISGETPFTQKRDRDLEFSHQVSWKLKKKRPRKTFLPPRLP